MSQKSIYNSNLPNITHAGKVRDTYELNDELLLMVVTDRISAFDVVMDTAIPRKGEVLAKMSEFWFKKTKHIIPNHFIGLASDNKTFELISDFPIAKHLDEGLRKRSMVVKKAKRIDIECIVRGYITGSAWSEYKKTKTVNKSKKLPPPAPIPKDLLAHELVDVEVEARGREEAHLAELRREAPVQLLDPAYPHQVRRHAPEGDAALARA